MVQNDKRRHNLCRARDELVRVRIFGIERLPRVCVDQNAGAGTVVWLRESGLR